MQAGSVVESKETLDGRVESFACAALLLSPRLAVVRFDHPGERRTGGFFFPAGSYTVGYFWRSRSYNCYRIAGPDTRVIAYRFDVVDRVRIRAGHVHYRDLLLDIWVSPSGDVTVEDEDELQEAVARGLLTPAEQNLIHRTRRLLLRDHARVLHEVEQIAHRL
ncbi:MAG: DUF402 domain-containing protein [Dehalococcoidia bacterium]